MGIIQRAHPLALNLGMVNNGPLAALATLKEYVPPLKPAIVLWFYFEGTISRTWRESGEHRS